MRSITVAQLLQAFPDDEAVERLFVTRRWPRRGGMSLLRREERAGRNRASADAISLSQLRAIFLGAHGDGYATIEDRLSGLADCHASGVVKRYRQRQHEAGPRTGNHAEVGMAAGLSDSRCTDCEAEVRLTGGVVKTALITLSSAAGREGNFRCEASRFFLAGGVEDFDMVRCPKNKNPDYLTSMTKGLNPVTPQGVSHTGNSQAEDSEANQETLALACVSRSQAANRLGYRHPASLRMGDTFTKLRRKGVPALVGYSATL